MTTVTSRPTMTKRRVKMSKMTKNPTARRGSVRAKCAYSYHGHNRDTNLTQANGKPAKKAKKSSQKKKKNDDSDDDDDDDLQDNAVRIELNSHVNLTFYLKYLVNFSKSTSLSNVVQLMMSNDVLLLVSPKSNTHPGSHRLCSLLWRRSPTNLARAISITIGS